ncbi:MAG: preprotein translocase subunit SecG [Candidatus Pacebacteria bacterium]|nr:preprotein translocase subunit SecG [Candidatus Paceibacterota bacterium]
MSLISIIQLVFAVLLIVLVLIQERSSGLSGAFGGSGDGGFYHTRRGLEKIIFFATIVSAIAFAGLALVDLVI